MILLFRGVLSLAFLSLPFIGRTQVQDLSDLEFGTPETFDVATWNIEWFPKEGNTTIEYVIDLIEEMELDVIAIQEIDQPSQFESLLDQLPGYDGFYQPNNYARLGFIYRTESVDLIEQYAIYSSEQFGNPFPRAPLIMRAQFQEETEIILINNHFKCCGNGSMDQSDEWDEETRRAYASELLKNYIDDFFPDENVILLGDLNDRLNDPPIHNVFQVFLDDPDNFRFADMAIAEGPSSQWSYPSWPSHLDHILISDELFPALESASSTVATIQIDEYFPGGWNGYEDNVSDHLPVAFSFNPGTLLSASQIGKEPKTVLYPNPSSGEIFIRSDRHWSGYTLHDVRGTVVLQGNINRSKNYSLNLTGLAAGVYTLHLTSAAGEMAVRRLVVEP